MLLLVLVFSSVFLVDDDDAKKCVFPMKGEEIAPSLNIKYQEITQDSKAARKAAPGTKTTRNPPKPTHFGRQNFDCGWCLGSLSIS